MASTGAQCFARRSALAAAALLCACNGSRDRLLAGLQSTRPEERAVAVKKLAEQNRSEDLVLFTQAAKDPSSLVRAEAISALARSQDARVVDLLGELLGDSDESVQGKAAMALAEIKSEKAKAYLTLQYGRRGRSTRQAIVQALKAANIPGPMAGVVAAESQATWQRNLDALQKGTLPERVGAAEALGKSGRAEAVNRLLPLLKDGQVILAAAAVRGLGYAGDRRAVGPISELLSENFPELREAALDALIQLQEPSALPHLLEVALERSPTSPLAAAAIAALPPSPETAQALCRVATEGAHAEAISAGRELRRRGSCPLEPILERLRQASQLEGGLQALVGLGPAAREALPKALPILAGADAHLRRLALDAVAELGDSSASPAVLKLYEQELKVVQQLRADWVIGELPQVYSPGFDPASRSDQEVAAGRLRQAELLRKVEALDQARAQAAHKQVVSARPPAEVVDDASEDQLRLLAFALRALGALRAEGALATLRSYSDDPSPALRAAALVGATALGPEGIAFAKGGLLDREREVQAAVAQALSERGSEGQAALLEVLPKLPGDAVRFVEALERSGAGEAAIEPLKVLVAEGGPGAVGAARMLGELRAKGAVEALVKYLEDPTGVARREVLVALGRIGDLRALEPMGRELYHDSPEIRAAAAEGLGLFARSAPGEAVAALRGGPHLDALDALKSDYYRRVREAAATALEQVK